MKTKLKRDDTVQVIAGREKGKTGKVLRINRVENRAIIQSLNMVKKAVKPRKQNDKGGIIDVEASIDLSNIMIVCRKCGPTRIGLRRTDGVVSRVCRKCGEDL